MHLSCHVRSCTAGRKQVEAEGSTLAEVMADLERRYPDFRFRVIDEQDRTRPRTNFFVGGQLTRDLQHPVRPGDEAHILGALGGG